MSVGAHSVSSAPRGASARAVEAPLVACGLWPRGVPATAAAQPFDFRLEPGEIACLIGPPGRGKSAWLRTLAAIEPPGRGELLLAGQDVDQVSEPEWRALQRRVGYVGDNPALLSALRANANVTLAAHYHRIGDGEAIRLKATALLERLGWTGNLDVLPAFLDEHEKRLLALARCLMLDPVILFLHEPFRMMDVAAGRQFGGVLAGLARDDGVAQVIVTHHLPFVRRCAHRILFAGERGLSAHDGWAALAESPLAEIREFLRDSDHDQPGSPGPGGAA